MKRSESKKRREVLRALHAESRLREREQIARQLSLPPGRRTNFLRVRLPTGGSCV